MGSNTQVIDSSGVMLTPYQARHRGTLDYTLMLLNTCLDSSTYQHLLVRSGMFRRDGEGGRGWERGREGEIFFLSGDDVNL